MTVYLITFGILMLYGISINHNASKSRRKYYIIFAFTVLTVLSMVRSHNVGRDLKSHYFDSFYRVINMGWSELSGLAYENGYSAFNKVISLFTSNGQWMIAIHALFVVGITGWFIYKNSENVVMSTFLFITTNAWFMYMNIMRQAMAVCMILIGTEILKQKKLSIIRYLLFVLIILFAMQFHTSAIVAIIIPIFEYIPFKRIHIILSSFGMVAAFILSSFIFKLLSLFQIGKRDYTEFYASSGAVINITSLYFVFIYILFFAIGILSLVFYKKKKASYKDEACISNSKEYSDSFLLYMLLATILCRIVGLRISIISRMSFCFMPYSFILVPRAINAINGELDRKIVKYAVYGLMTLAFIVLGYTNAAVLYGTVPYQFFWEI